MGKKDYEFLGCTVEQILEWKMIFEHIQGTEIYDALLRLYVAHEISEGVNEIEVRVVDINRQLQALNQPPQ